ncbi:MAG: sulfotransferase family 2 domain-containing protein [Paracoccaceae bacterium]
MTRRFEYFIIFAEMRTGSNFLEENLNDRRGLHCYGEVYNPSFIGHAGQTQLLGVSLADREADPVGLLARMRQQTDGLPGFRFFHDHDPRIKATCLADPACAKIILTRNPVESYISREIVRQTGQWRIGDAKGAKTARVRFDPAEFKDHLASRQAFQVDLLRALQASGQTAFYLDYEDIGQIDVLNGLARFLGLEERKKSASQKTKKQNPQPLKDKVQNFDEMVKALESVDHFNLSRTPNFEPRRGPVVPNFIAAARSSLLFVPIKAGPSSSIASWMADLDGVAEVDLEHGFTQKTLRHWKRRAKAHQSFAVLRHPVARLHSAFVNHILMPGPECYREIREILRKTYGLAIPEKTPDDGYDAAAHRSAFLQFAAFVKVNLSGQTSIRVDGAWASQSEILRGVCQFMIPDHVFREDEIDTDLAYLAQKVGMSSPVYHPTIERAPVSLMAIHDDSVEEAVKAAYQKDYMLFGFGPYRKDHAA